MDPEQFTTLLHRRIPLTAAMGLKVTHLSGTEVSVLAPLRNNTNVHDTMFGGTLAALGLVSGWVLLHSRLREADLEAMVVGQKSEVEFLNPGTADCIATTTCDESKIAGFVQAVWQRGRALLEVATLIRADEVEVARHRGVFVAVIETQRRM